MLTRFLPILPPSFPSISFLGVPPPGAHHHVRAPSLPPSTTATIKMAPKSLSSLILIFHLLITSLHSIVSFSQSDVENLLKFRESLENATALANWGAGGAPPCNGDHANWNGVLCEKGRVWGLQLEHMGLSGVIDVDTLAKLQDLRTISFMNNNFEGSLPNLTKLGVLKTIYLSNNKFSGEISPTIFNRMMSLKKLHLANNEFSGPIPLTMAGLPKLMELTLENNHFVGEIPSFHQEGLKGFNVSNNELIGPIPSTLSRFNASSFAGNTDLCGAPLEPCASRKHLPLGTIIIVAILVAAALIALIAVLIILHRRKKNSNQPEAAAATTMAAAGGHNKETTARDLDRMEQGQARAAGSSSPDNGKHTTKLTFLKDTGDRFDLPDLLKASAEVLGSGIFGSTYKAALSNGKAMVVKRFRHMNNVSREDFNEHMRRLGRMNHQNVLPIVAFYYRKEEKLLIADYVENVSLAFQLHGNGRSSLDWPTRLNIIKGVAKGLQYLYNELPSLTAPHGHLKSSNVLLDSSFKPLLTDYGLVPVVNQVHAHDNMISYKSPEFKGTRHITKKTDIWSLGILILEILTGKFPSNLLQQGGAADVDLSTWVESVINDDGGSNKMDVFDSSMVGATHSDGEMMKLLKIGLMCCQADVDRRPEIREVVEKIEEIKERDFDEEFYSCDGDVRSSRGLSDDFKSINI